MRPPEFHRLTEQELNESAQFYDLEDPGLGSAFLQEIARCLQSIEAHPMAGALVRGDVRRRLITASRLLFYTGSRPTGSESSR